jgi:antitoxin CptB
MTDPEHAAPDALRPPTTDPTVAGASRRGASETSRQGASDISRQGASDVSRQDASGTSRQDVSRQGASDTSRQDASDMRRRRLLFRATHRGTHENDLIIGGFVKAHLTMLSETDLDALEAVMQMQDTDLADWLTGRVPIPPEEETAMLRRMRTYIRDPLER